MSLLSVLISLATWIAYFARLPSGHVPARPVGSVVAQILALGLALGGFVGLLREASTAWLVVEGGAAAFGLMASSLFLWLLTQRKTPVGDLKVGVGDRLPSFEALTDTGRPFSSEELSGRRVLLKFFRGHW